MDALLRARLDRLPDGLHRLRLDGGGAAVAKRRRDAPAGFFAMEAHGLALLRAAGGLRVPQVLALADGAIALEDLGRGRPSQAHWHAAGGGLARQHACVGERFGLDRDGWCGDAAQANTPDDDGWRFFVRCRLLPLARRARDAGWLEPADTRAIDALCARLRERVPEQPPSLLHGDLWSGNVHACAGGELALIDAAAVHHGWAEADLAMLVLFGAPPPAFFEGYAEARRLRADWRTRAPLYNLSHQLNHLVLFGGGHLGAVRHALRRLA